MRRKTLLTVVLCMALAAASQSVSSEYHNLSRVKAESTEGEAELVSGGAENPTEPAATESQPTEPPQTDPPQTESKPAETQPTESKPAETQPTESKPAETQPAESKPTEPPQTEPPQTESKPAETQPTESKPTEPAQTNPPQTESKPAESEPTTPQQTESQTAESSTSAETKPADTEKVTEGAQSETPGETAPTETAPSESAPTEAAPAVPAPTPAETVPTEAAPAETAPEEIVPDEESESESESETEGISNDELIARQTIVIPPQIEKEFRFTRVDKRYAIVRVPEGAHIYEEKSEDAREVGTLNYYGYCYILEDQDDGWYYIESGNVRGFVRAEDVVTDEVANRIVKIKGMEELSAARLLVARTENSAYTHTHTTVQKVIAAPNYALASGDVNIYEQKKESSRVVGTMSENTLCCILEDADENWVFVESGDARGFVERAALATGPKIENIISSIGEQNMQLAQVLVEPEDNKACYYTLTSVQEASQAAKTREAMVNFATQFVGNPYVWGGTSLTEGADCSGFVQTVYSYFGYSLPRVAEDQSHYGMQIPIESAETGDLIFYARNGYVYHVSMYIGDGQVVQAAGRKVGIIISGIGGNAVWATRVIHD